MGTHLGPENTGPVRRFGQASSFDGLLSLPGAELQNVLWVDVGSNPVATADGSCQLPYHSIDTAVNAAAALTPTANNPVAIVAMPGEYNEQVALDTDYVYLFGWNRDSTVLRHTSDPLTITTTHTAVRGLTVGAQASGVRPLDVSTGDPTVAVRIEECQFDCVVADPNPANVHIQNDSYVVFKDCRFTGVVANQDVVQQDDGDLTTSEFWECEIGGSLDYTRGNVLLKGCEVHGHLDFDFAGRCQVFDCLLSRPGGSPVVELPTNAEFRDNVFETAAQSYDIDGAANQCVIQNNVFSGLGMYYTVGTQSNRKYVGVAGQCDYYKDVAYAMASSGNDPYVIELLTDVVQTYDFNTTGNGPITIDGQGHSWTRANGLQLIRVYNSWIRFRNIHLEGEVQVSVGSDPTLEMLEGTTLTGRINLDGGTSSLRIRLDGAEVIGDTVTGHCIRIVDDDPTIEVFRSRLKGNSGSPAIYWDNGKSNGNVKIKYSTVWHGTGGANLPFGRDAGQTPDYRSHHTRYNTDPTAGGIWTNLIAAAQRHDSYDVQTDY